MVPVVGLRTGHSCDLLYAPIIRIVVEQFKYSDQPACCIKVEEFFYGGRQREIISLRTMFGIFQSTTSDYSFIILGWLITVATTTRGHYPDIHVLLYLASSRVGLLCPRQDFCSLTWFVCTIHKEDKESMATIPVKEAVNGVFQRTHGMVLWSNPRLLLWSEE